MGNGIAGSETTTPCGQDSAARRGDRSDGGAGSAVPLARAATEDENGRDESRFVRNRIPFFPDRFRFFRDKRKRDRKRDGVNGNGTENGRAFVRPYLRYPVFNRDIPFFVPFFFNTGWACWACFFFRRCWAVGP
jgi:hypothetical protein